MDNTVYVMGSRSVTAMDILLGDRPGAGGLYDHPCRRASYWARAGHPHPYSVTETMDVAIASLANRRRWPRAKLMAFMASSIGSAVGATMPRWSGDAAAFSTALRECIGVGMDAWNVRLDGAGEGD